MTISRLALQRLLMLCKNITQDNSIKWKKTAIWKLNKSRSNLTLKWREVYNEIVVINKNSTYKDINFLINFNRNLLTKRFYRMNKNQQLSTQIDTNANRITEVHLLLTTLSKLLNMHQTAFQTANYSQVYETKAALHSCLVQKKTIPWS